MKRTVLVLALFAVSSATYALNCSNSSALFNAAYAGNRSVIEDYAKNHCSLSIKDRRGFSLYDIASLQGDAKLQQWLVAQHVAREGEYGVEMIKLVQTGLRYLNMDAGLITGKMNPTTNAAIKKYQQSLAQKPTGKITAKWLPYFNRTIIKQVQRDLNNLGYKAGTADGVIGSGTRAAIQAFRDKKKLGVYSQIDDQLIYQLMLAENDLQKKTSSQSKTKKASTPTQAKSVSKVKPQQTKTAVQKVSTKAKKTVKKPQKSQVPQVQKIAKGARRLPSPVVVTPPIAIQSPKVTTIVAEKNSEVLLPQSNINQPLYQTPLKQQQTQNENNNINATNATKVGGISVNKRFNKLSGVLHFTGGADACHLNEQKIAASWCRTYYPSGENKQCDAVISKTGVVVSLRCK